MKMKHEKAEKGGKGEKGEKGLGKGKGKWQKSFGRMK